MQSPKHPTPPNQPRQFVTRVTFLIVMGAVGACSPGKAAEQVVTHREVTVACGRCIFEMKKATTGCPWAVEIDGHHYLVQGEVPQGHQNHAPDGICNMRRRAIVDGTIRGDRFISTHFELKRAGGVPENPRYTPEDVH